MNFDVGLVTRRLSGHRGGGSWGACSRNVACTFLGRAFGPVNKVSTITLEFELLKDGC